MTNNKQQTSIDWFFDQLVLNRIIIINGTTYWDKVKTKYEILLQQAKEMHQEEIENAYGVGFEEGDNDPFTGEAPRYLNCTDYYNKTYGDGVQ